MKKIGLPGRARKVGKDEGANQDALFGGAKAKAPGANPYAIQQTGGANDPYAPQSTPPPSYDGGMSDFRKDKSPVPPGGYGGSRFGSSGVNDNDGGYGGSYGGSDSGSRYGNSGANYGDQGGYGSNRFGGTGIQEGLAARRPGGYGGMGMSTQEAEAGRQQLFGDAPKRSQTVSAPPNADGGVASTYTSARAGGYGAGSDSQGYGGYEDRELTAEEQEEEDINATVHLVVLSITIQLLTILAETRNSLRQAARRLFDPQRPPSRRPSLPDRCFHPGAPRCPR